MIDITITYADDEEHKVARQLVNELEDRLGGYPANVWVAHEDYA